MRDLKPCKLQIWINIIKMYDTLTLYSQMEGYNADINSNRNEKLITTNVK